MKRTGSRVPPVPELYKNQQYGHLSTTSDKTVSVPLPVDSKTGHITTVAHCTSLNHTALERSEKRSFSQSVRTCLSQSSNFISVTLNPTHMRRNQSHGYVDFQFWVVWPIAWFDYFTMEIVHASVHENEMWNDILSARSSSHCHLWKVAYLTCSFLVLSASSRLYWKRSAPVGSRLWHYEWSVMPTDHLHLCLVIVIKRAKFDRWPHVILTSESHAYQKYAESPELWMLPYSRHAAGPNGPL